MADAGEAPRSRPNGARRSRAAREEKGLALECEIGEPSLAVYADGACLARASRTSSTTRSSSPSDGSVRVRIDRDSQGRALSRSVTPASASSPGSSSVSSSRSCRRKPATSAATKGTGSGSRSRAATSSSPAARSRWRARRAKARASGSCCRRLRGGAAGGRYVVVACEADREPPWLVGLAGAPRVHVEKGADAARSRLEDERHRAAGLVLSLGLGESGFALGRALREDPWWGNLP